MWVTNISPPYIVTCNATRKTTRRKQLDLGEIVKRDGNWTCTVASSNPVKLKLARKIVTIQ